MMKFLDPKVYEFGPFQLYGDEKVLRRGGRMVALTPKAFDILWTLVAANGRVLSKEELLAAVWPGTFVEEGNLTFNISVLRKALAAEGGEANLIQTVPRRGYRLAIGTTEMAPPAPVVEKSQAPQWTLAIAAIAVLAVAAGFVYSRIQTPRIQSIAILPLRPIGGVAAPEPLSIGLADAIITKLAGLSRLIVRPTATVARYDRADHDPLAAGRALQVDAVLTGTIQRTPDRVRVAAQLFTVADGREIWADHFDTTARDLFGLEDTISERVAAALRVNLSPDDRRAIAKRYTSDAEAHELYLTGSYHRNRWTLEGAVTARQYFEQAIAKDRNYALAYVGLADALAVSSHFGGMSTEDAHKRKQPLLDEAIRLDPLLAEAHAARAMDALAHDWDGAAALREMQEALRLGPNLASLHSRYAAILLALGRHDLDERQKAADLEPPSPLYIIGVGWAHFYARDYRKADQYYQAAMTKDSGFAGAYWSLGESLEMQGRLPEAIAAFERSVLLTNRNPRALSGLGHAYGLAGRRAEALAIAAELHEKARSIYVSPFFIAVVYLGTGDRDKFFDWLERAVAERSDWLVFIHVHPMFDSVRQEPRFRDIVQRVGLAASPP